MERRGEVHRRPLVRSRMPGVPVDGVSSERIEKHCGNQYPQTDAEIPERNRTVQCGQPQHHLAQRPATGILLETRHEAEGQLRRYLPHPGRHGWRYARRAESGNARRAAGKGRMDAD